MRARFIPAYAGNSFVSPHTGRHDAGSSPLTRGTLLAIKASRCARTVHPRLRGELDNPLSSMVGTTGSSPLTRGTQRKNNIGRAFNRFIPAYAGNSGMRRSTVLSSSVHPRLRGELYSRLTFMIGCRGSSPLTRGTRLRLESEARRLRFIPAYAGNS